MKERDPASRRPSPCGRRVSISDADGIVRFGVLCKGVDRTGPWPTVTVALNGRIERVDARDVELWPRIGSAGRAQQGNRRRARHAVSDGQHDRRRRGEPRSRSEPRS